MDLWRGPSSGGPPDFTMLDMADPLTMAQLRAKLDELEALDDVGRAREAREMSDVAQATFQAIGDEAIFRASRRMTNGELLKLLGYTEDSSVVTEAIRRHLIRRPEDKAERKPAGRPRRQK